jgi:hypothetical protein
VDQAFDHSDDPNAFARLGGEPMVGNLVMGLSKLIAQFETRLRNRTQPKYCPATRWIACAKPPKSADRPSGTRSTRSPTSASRDRGSAAEDDEAGDSREPCSGWTQRLILGLPGRKARGSDHGGRQQPRLTSRPA